MKTSRRFRIAGLVTLLPLTLSAQVSWTGAGLDSDWATSGNWSPAAPTDADTVTISAGHAFVTTTDAVAGTLTVGNVAGSGGELTVSTGGALTVGDDGAGTLSIYKNSAVNIGSGGFAGTLSVGEIALEDSGPIDPETSPGVTLATLAFDHTDDVTFGARLSGGGLLTKTGAGTLTLTGNSVADINNAYAFGGLAQVTGGTLVLDAGTGYWDGGGDFEVSGSGSVLRIAAGTSFANDITAINGTVEVGGVLEEGFDGYTFTDATLRVLNGGAITSGDFLLGGASVLRLDGTNAISGGSFTFDGTSTLDATTPGAITDGEFIFTGDRTIALPAPGVIIGGDIVLTDNTSGTLGQTGMLVPYYDAGADEYAYLGLTATDTADISVSAIGAIQNTLIAIQDESTLALGATGAVSDSMIYLIGGGTITLGAEEALDDTVLLMAGDSIMVDDVEVPRAPTLDLNGHNLSLAALLGMEGLIINNTETAVTLTIGMACGCGGPGGPSGFFGTITEGSTGKIGVTVVGGSDFAIGGTQTYTGPTIVDGSGFYVVNNHDIDNNIVSGALANSPVTLQNGGRLGGDGTLLSPVTVFGGGEITPGDYGMNPTGVLTTAEITFADDSLVAEHSVLTIDIYDAAALTPGAGVDFWNVAGNFTFSPDLNDTFTVRIRSLGDFDNLALNFDPGLAQSWHIASFGGSIVNFDTSRILVDASLFANSPGLWTLSRGGTGDKDLFLNFAPIPEPAAFVLLGSLGVLPALLRRRRR